MNSYLKEIRFFALAVVLWFAGPSQVRAAEVPGPLFIIGGGSHPAGMLGRFIELAGGTNRARIVVLPMASEAEAESGAAQVAEFKSSGATRVESLVFNRAQAMDLASAARLDGATGIYFTGGDQSRLAAVLVDTTLQIKLAQLRNQGTVIGGTSAGAAIMSEVMITGEELRNEDKKNAFRFIKKDNIEVARGLGFITNSIIDQHFIQRKRFSRLLSVVLEHPTLVGIGIDESTAILVKPDQSFEVLGESGVLVIDARSASGFRVDSAGHLAAQNIKTHLLLAGDRFDMTRGAPRLLREGYGRLAGTHQNSPPLPDRMNARLQTVPE